MVKIFYARDVYDMRGKLEGTQLYFEEIPVSDFAQILKGNPRDGRASADMEKGQMAVSVNETGIPTHVALRRPLIDGSEVIRPLIDSRLAILANPLLGNYMGRK